MFNPLSTNFTNWSNTLKQFIGKLPTNCLSVFDHFVGLALKGLRLMSWISEFSFQKFSSENLQSFSIKNIFHDNISLRLFYPMWRIVLSKSETTTINNWQIIFIFKKKLPPDFLLLISCTLLWKIVDMQALV